MEVNCQGLACHQRHHRHTTAHNEATALGGGFLACVEGYSR